MDKELKPRTTLPQVAAVVLVTLLTIAVLAVIASLCLGCGKYMHTQTPISYTGTVSFKSYVVPPDVRRNSLNRSSGVLVGYWDQPTYGIFSILNGQTYPVRFLLDCGYYEPTVTVPALTMQDILVDTTPAHAGRDLCTVIERTDLPNSAD